MIIHDKVVFVENPKTASSYIADLLIEDGGYRQTPRHGFLTECTDQPSFVVVRDPYQRAYSAWKYMDSIDKKYSTLGEWLVHSGHPFARSKQRDYIKNVDHVLFFETIYTEFSNLMRTLDVGVDMDYNPPQIHELTEQDIRTVEELFEEDFLTLGYKMILT